MENEKKEKMLAELAKIFRQYLEEPLPCGASGWAPTEDYFLEKGFISLRDRIKEIEKRRAIRRIEEEIDRKYETYEESQGDNDNDDWY